MNSLPEWLQLVAPLVGLISLIAVMWHTVQTLQRGLSKLDHTVEKLNDSVAHVMTGDAVSEKVVAHITERLGEISGEILRMRKSIHDVRNLTVYVVGKSARGADPEVKMMLQAMTHED